MRLSLLSLLLLTASSGSFTAAVAQPDGVNEQAEGSRSPGSRARAERQNRDVDAAARPARSDWAEPRERPRDAEAVRQAPPPRHDAAPDPVRAVTATAPRPRRDEPRSGGGEVASPERRAYGAAGGGWRGGSGERRGRNRDVPPTAGSPVYGNAIPTPVTVTQPSRVVSPGTVAAGDLRNRIAAEGLRRDRIERDGWRREWRQDRRYDWRRHRDHDRARFHLSIYVDPFGWRYREYDIGWRLPARYYASRYWILDPYYYSLPPVSGRYRWVRYHGDVLLVDLRTGRVLDRIRDFFW
ncbi:Ni/Co efflux regulator RcnB [Sphingomonas kaistensis]|uniref:Ni/Co efflux regulator RcnB n=1 Tax=Sphingomonas kaistensis TaxID=298708 RepID=A0A7X5Y4V8_9SPHN|nr:RcnB family protein [Sphingomonas kaistensis]NJC04577.1 Ni/Co efflux regulator RcnB [Sphingomonas kaistensis]